MTEKWKLYSDIVGNFTIKSENQSIGRFIRLEGKQCQYVVELLNKQDERIKELETRNKRQYERLKKITDLIFNRDWETLELIVEDWEESNGLLQAEYGNCGDVE